MARQQKEKEENEKIAAQLDSLENNDELLAGLDELQKQEIAQLEQTKQLYTPRGEKKEEVKENSENQGQGQQNSQQDEVKKPEPNEEPGSGLGPVATVAFAIGVAGIVYLTRKFWMNQ